MAHAEPGGDDRIAKLCTMVSRRALVDYIGSEAKYNDVTLPRSSTAQQLLRSTVLIEVYGCLRELIGFLGRDDIHGDPFEVATALAAMPPIDTFPEGFWDIAVADVLETCPTITSNVTPGKAPKLLWRDGMSLPADQKLLATKMIGEFDTGRCVESSVVDMTVAEQIAGALMERKTVNVCGESGSGKTTAMLLAAVALETAPMRSEDPLTPFAVYTDPRERTCTFRRIEHIQLSVGGSAPCKLPLERGRRVHPLADGVAWQWNDSCGCKSCERDHQAAQLLVHICDAIPAVGAHRKPYHAVVVVDELGSYPGFVRAVCALGEAFRANLATHLKVARVSIVMGGTGCEAHDLGCGLLPNEFCLIHAATNLWPALVASNCKLSPFDVLMAPPDAALGLPDVRAVTAKLAHDLASNARAAAFLANELVRVSASVTPGEACWNPSLLFGMAAVRAALQYKASNCLCDLSQEAHRLLVLSAVAASHYLPFDMELVPLVSELSPRMHSCIMVDRGVVTATGGKRFLTLDAK